MAEKKKYNSILISGRKDQTLTYSKYVKNEESGESVKESLDKKVNVTDELTTQQIKDGAITNEKMAADSVGNTNLQDGSVSNEKLEDGSITNEKLAENSITKDKLKDNTIGVEKLDPELRQTINAATGLPEDLVETIQNVDDTLKDHQIQLDDKQSQIDDKQQQITDNDEDISLLQTRSTQMEETIKSIAATGGASQATAVTYNNEKSGLIAVNTQAAIDEVNSKIIYDVSACNHGVVFESLQALLNSASLDTFIPASVRRGGMTIRFIQSSVLNSYNKYVQYRLISYSWSAIVSDWQSENADDEPTAGSDNLVSSNGIFESFNLVDKEINGNYLVLLSSLTVYQDNAYINGSGQIISNDTSKILSMPLGDISEISYRMNQTSMFATLIVKRGEEVVGASMATTTEDTIYDVSEYDSSHTLYINWFGANTENPNMYLDRITVLSNGLSQRMDSLEEKTKGIQSDTAFDFINNTFIRKTDGAVIGASGSEWHCTDKIKVYKGDKLHYKCWANQANDVVCIAAYNNDVFVEDKSIFGDDATLEDDYIVPSGVTHIAACNYNTRLNNPVAILTSNVLDELQGDVEDISKSLFEAKDEISKIKNVKFKSLVRKQFIFEGKTVKFCGDSITWGYVDATHNVHNIADYPKIFCESVGLKWDVNINLGKLGATITPGQVDNNGNPCDVIKDQIIAAKESAPDYLFIAGGVNDCQCGVTKSAFIAAVKDYCDYINSNYSDKTQVIWITPINEDYDNKSRRIMSLQEYRNILTETVILNDTYSRFSIIQGTDFNFPDEEGSSELFAALFADKLHPSDYGYKLYASELEKVLNRAYNWSIVQETYSAIFNNNDVVYGCGEDVYSTLNYTNNSSIYFQSVNGQIYPQKVTRATFLKSDAGTIKFYKATIKNNVASDIVLIKSVTGVVNETSLDVELGENEFIGISGNFTYKNGGDPIYSSQSCNVSGGDVANAASQVLGYTLYGTVTNSIVDRVDELETRVDRVDELETSLEALQDRKANVIIVDQSGKGDFTSLEDALHVVTDRTTPWGLTIIVKPGTYTMSTWVGNDERYYGAYRMLSIIGTNKNACKIICNKGVYTTSPYRDSSPIKLAGNCLIENLTILSSDSESEDPESDNESYCVHLDFETSPSVAIRLTLKDCILQNDHYACVGIGLHNNYTVEILNCEMSSTFKTDGDSVGAVLCHEGSDTGSCKLIMRNNVIKSSGAYGLSLHSPYSGSIDIELCNNIIDADGAGFLYDSTKHIKDNLCFGNNIQAMNK